MKERKFACSPIVPGSVNGPALTSDEAICFYLVEPDTGVVVEENHVLFGKSMEGKVLVAHAGKGSSVVQMDGLFKIMQKGKGPKAVILRNPDPVFVSALLVMELPSVYNVEDGFYQYVKDGMSLSIDADANCILAGENRNNGL